MNHRRSHTPNLLEDRISPYQAYRDPGIEWEGQIPAHWEIKRLKHLLVEPLKYGANEPAELTDYSLPRFIRITDIREDGTLRDDSFRSLPEDIAKPYILVSGDILFARSGATVGKTFRYQPGWGKAAHAGYLIRARLDNSKSVPNFVEYFTQSRNYTNWLQSNFIQATIQNVSAERYAGLNIAVPPLPEQRTIASFLDRETARIDALVEKKERLIELLQEKRAALISHVVTRGLDPNVLTKDSGLEWLGEIPAHWELSRLKHLVDFFTGWTPPTGQENLYRGKHFWANISDLGPKIIRKTDNTISSDAIRKARLKSVSPGSLLFSFKLSIGIVSIAGAEMYTNEAIAAFVPSSRIHTGYLYWAAPIFVPANAQLNIYGARLLNKERIENAHLLCIPDAEQRAIADFLDRETARIDALITKVREAIGRLKELRQALISAAVTGKIDVREEVA